MHTYIYILYLQYFEFEKAPVPETKEAKLELIKKPGKYNVSLTQYERSLNQTEIKQ